MIKKVIQWLNKLDSNSKILILFFFIVLFIFSPQTLVPPSTLLIILENIQNWLAHFRSLFSWQSALFGFVSLLLLHIFFFFGRTKKIVNIVLDWSSRNQRLILVLTTGIIESIILYYCWRDLIVSSRADTLSEKLPSWMGTVISTLIIAPVAFFIWLFRNADKAKDLQHAEENIRQADFHKIEEWATTFPQDTSRATEAETTIEQTTTQTNIDVDNSSKRGTKKETEPGVLQIAAIYQLLPYAKGEYGKRFIRPAIEIYRSLLASWQWSEEEQRLAENGLCDQIAKPAYIEALHTIFKQEAVFFFYTIHTLPLIQNSNWKPLLQIDLKGANFSGMNLEEANFEGANLKGAAFIQTNLFMANFRNTHLGFANLTESCLEETNFENAYFTKTYLSKADLDRANLKGANFTEANLTEANLENANFKEAILFKANLKNSYLGHTNFTKAMLEEANLMSVTFEGANLSVEEKRNPVKRLDREKINPVKVNVWRKTKGGRSIGLIKIGFIGADFSDANCCGLIFSDTLIGGKFTNSGILHDKTTQSARHQF